MPSLCSYFQNVNMCVWEAKDSNLLTSNQMHANENKWVFRENHLTSKSLDRIFLESLDPAGEGSIFVLLFDFHFVLSCDISVMWLVLYSTSVWKGVNAQSKVIYDNSCLLLKSYSCDHTISGLCFLICFWIVFKRPFKKFKLYMNRCNTWTYSASQSIPAVN